MKGTENLVWSVITWLLIMLLVLTIAKLNPGIFDPAVAAIEKALGM